MVEEWKERGQGANSNAGGIGYMQLRILSQRWLRQRRRVEHRPSGDDGGCSRVVDGEQALESDGDGLSTPCLS